MKESKDTLGKSKVRKIVLICECGREYAIESDALDVIRSLQRGGCSDCKSKLKTRGWKNADHKNLS